MDSNKPHFVSSAFKKDEEYIHWLQKVKEQYRSSQAKAAMRVNDAMIEFYWKLGHDIVDLKAESKWGTGVIEQLSLDMKTAFPDVRGFSTTNLWYVKQWYVFYSKQYSKMQRAVAELQKLIKLPQVVGELFGKEKLPQLVAEVGQSPKVSFLGDIIVSSSISAKILTKLSSISLRTLMVIGAAVFLKTSSQRAYIKRRVVCHPTSIQPCPRTIARR